MVNALLQEQAERPDPEITAELSEQIAEGLQDVNNKGTILWLFLLATKHYAQLPESHDFDITDYQMTAEQIMLEAEQ
jgi:hypothetical protein